MKTAYSDKELIKLVPGFTNNYTTINDLSIHYVSGGTGEPFILIPGYPETWWAYHHVMPILAENYQVIVVEIRGMGSSDKPENGYEKKNIAKDIYELVKYLGFEKVFIAGHDIGAHVAFSFACNYPQTTSKLIMLDTPHPDPSMYQLPMLPILGASYLYPWWLAFNQVKELPEKLLEGRMSIVISWLFDNLLVNKDSINQFDRSVYRESYDNKNAIRCSNAWYQAFPQDIKDYEGYNKLEMPVLAIGASGYDLLQHSLPTISSNLILKKIENCGHFILAEKPIETAGLIKEFLAS
ncbi:MAG: alpha/beta hydrolase [Sphingobacterium sp.]|jgi:pimeloyl-ACP methyl ester carboxylesterase|uniref:alpha/beta fold hydrolase n=1 Tax=unclassified Sphingobacterium TaxID=2609468 RepID=UPI00283D19C0|nr:alpha/beta hydrolase [Sphingobacterium sp.]MDR3007322.1 alpha/beta hydrolase [Sphingobacterium sp.]